MDQSTIALLSAGVMIVVFLGAWFLKVPHIISLTLAAIGGALVAGNGIPLRHLVEGSFMFFDLVLIILTAMMFLGVLRETGALSRMILDIIRRFHRQPFILLSVLTLVVMLPGALTGSGTAAVLAVGSLVGAVLIGLGIPAVNTVAIIALAGVIGSFAPPVNIPAMAMANGINMPYSGMFFALALISIPLGLICSIVLGGRYLKRNDQIQTLIEEMEETTKAKAIGPLATYLPLVFVLGTMILTRIFPGSLPNPGIPMIFILGLVLALILSPRLKILPLVTGSIREAMPVVGILIGVGAFVQVMTLTGVRGLFVITAVTLPEIGLYVFILLGFVLAGALLGSYGSGTVFGIPVTLALLDRDPVLAIIGLSLMAAFSSLTPPTAIVGQAAVMSVGYEGSYGAVLKKMWLPWLIASLIGLAIVVFADRLDWLVRY